MAVKTSDKKKQVAPGIWQLIDGRFYGEVRPNGATSRRLTKTAEKLGDIKDWIFEKQTEAKSGGFFKASTRDKRTLTDLANEWQKLYGYTLKDNERHQVLIAICKRLGNPIAKKFTAEDFLIYRKTRIQTNQKSINKPVSPNTVNHEQAYLSAMFSTLIKLKKWDENPLRGVDKLKIDDPGLVYLELDQVERLLSALEYSQNPDLKTIARICLATGARWGEASSLCAENIKNGQIQYINTKSGKARAIPISKSFEREILAGRNRFGRLFADTCHKKGFANALKRAEINLPDGQSTHVLRHTFASIYMINDGNILKLREILGHASLEMTMRYAHLAPKHLTQALTHNPLAVLELHKAS
jgi:integrase